MSYFIYTRMGIYDVSTNKINIPISKLKEMLKNKVGEKLRHNTSLLIPPKSYNFICICCFFSNHFCCSSF